MHATTHPETKVIRRQTPAARGVRIDVRTIAYTPRNFQIRSAYWRSSLVIGIPLSLIQTSGSADPAIAIMTIARSVTVSRGIVSARRPVRTTEPKTRPAPRTRARSSFGRRYRNDGPTVDTCDQGRRPQEDVGRKRRVPRHRHDEHGRQDQPDDERRLDRWGGGNGAGDACQCRHRDECCARFLPRCFGPRGGAIVPHPAEASRAVDPPCARRAANASTNHWSSGACHARWIRT